jgi:hypothetical protein
MDATNSRGMIRDEMMAGPACSGRSVGRNYKYVTDISADQHKLINNPTAASR